MASLQDIKTVVNKICSIGTLGKHMCLFGGSIPYIYYNKESNREHSDIDILIETDYIDTIRQLAQQSNLDDPNLDSLNLGLGEDYGLKLTINGVYVEFEPMSIEDGMLIRKSFSPKKKIVGTEKIPFEHYNDLIVELDLGETKTFCQSPELIKAEKEQYKREKDLLDIEFIDSQGIDIEKYERVKRGLELSQVSLSNYEYTESKKMS